MSPSAEIHEQLATSAKAPPKRKSFSLNDWGMVGAGIIFCAAFVAGHYDNKHQDVLHEHRNVDNQPFLYVTAPSRQALRMIIGNQHVDDRSNAEALIQANIEVNSCLEEYQSHVNTLLHNCGSYTNCLSKFSTTDEDDNVIFNPESGLGGATPGFSVNYRLLMNTDINRGPTSYTLTEKMNTLTILPHKVEQSLRRHRAQLEACRRNIALVDRSLATLQREQSRH